MPQPAPPSSPDPPPASLAAPPAEGARALPPHVHAPAVESLQRADRDAALALDAGEGLLAVHPNTAHWWNHASFALPLLGAVGFVIVGLVADSAEALGFGLFLGAVALFMLPVVLLTWRGTATAVALTRTRALALHRGRTLRSVAWAEVAAIERVETMGNVRWRLRPHAGLPAPDGVPAQHLAVEGEIADVPGLVARAAELAGVPAPPTGLH